MRAAMASAALAIALAATVTACATGGTPGSVTSVAIDGGDRTLVVGDVVALTATVTATGGASTTVAWTSDDEAVATVDAAGQVTALAEGTADITATSDFDPTKTATVTITVDPIGVLHWTRQFGTTSADHARGMASDPQGNVYVAGDTRGALDGPQAGGTDSFVRAYDADGNLRWGRQFGASAVGVLAVAVATDPLGNVYVAGNTDAALDGPHAGGVDAFLRAYDPDGNLRWARQFGTASADSVGGMAADADGNVYVAGTTYGDLGGANTGGYDAFVHSYDATGNVRWTRQFGTTSNDSAGAVATDAHGDVYVAGSTQSALDGVHKGESDVFVRAYDAAGDVRWARQFGTTSPDAARGVATDAHGHVYVGGTTQGALDGSHAGSSDAFVRAYDRDGDVRWARQFGTNSVDDVQALAGAADGGVFAGGFTGGALAGIWAGDSDAFVRKYGR